MSNEIILRSVYGKVNQTYFIQPCPNPKTGKLPACVKTVDSRGDMILSEDEVKRMNLGEVHFVPANYVFEIVDGTSFDLSDVVGKANWEAIEYCNWIAKDRYQRDEQGNLIIDGGAKRYGVADLYVERPGEITKAKVNKKQYVYRALSYIYEDSETERIKKCRVLGRNLTTAIPADILDYLIETAERNPKTIIDLYEGEDWKMHLFILDAIDRGVIRKSDGIYKYDDKMLGGSIEATITFLRDIRFKKLVDSIKRETYPNLLTKTEISELEETMTEGIPHFDEVVAKPKPPTKK
ncbi:MAG: hypothetical protein ACOH2V_00110 [Candidatus Saccharimonadaceae bacterium]